MSAEALTAAKCSDALKAAKAAPEVPPTRVALDRDLELLPWTDAMARAFVQQGNIGYRPDGGAVAAAAGLAQA
jgi:hypothetical protein